jgi:hypothetical protein
MDEVGDEKDTTKPLQPGAARDTELPHTKLPQNVPWATSRPEDHATAAAHEAAIDSEGLPGVSVMFLAALATETQDLSPAQSTPTSTALSPIRPATTKSSPAGSIFAIPIPEECSEFPNGVDTH